MNRRSRCRLHSFAFACGLLACACSYHARSADDYRRATRELLETRRSEVKRCYDTELKQDERVGGTVVVRFKVEADSGKITQPAVVPERTTAPEALSQCVVNSLDGLTLDPPDARTGEAEYSWEFQVDRG